jgi:hypothetical protein
MPVRDVKVILHRVGRLLRDVKAILHHVGRLLHDVKAILRHVRRVLRDAKAILHHVGRLLRDAKAILHRVRRLSPLWTAAACCRFPGAGLPARGGCVEKGIRKAHFSLFILSPQQAAGKKAAAGCRSPGESR